MLNMIALYALSKLAEKDAIDKDLKKKEKLNEERKQKLAAISDARRKRTMATAAESYDPTKRKAAEDIEQAGTKQQLVSQLTAPNQPGVTPLATPEFTGKMSGDELTARANTTAARTQHGSDFADILSRLSAPQAVNLQNALRMGDTSNINRLGAGEGNRISADYDQRIAATSPNSLQMILANLGQTYAMGSMMGDVTGGTGAGGTTADPNKFMGPRSYGYNAPTIPTPYRVPYTPIR